MPNAEDPEGIFDSVVGSVSLRASDLGRLRDFYAEAIGLDATDDGPAVTSLSDAKGRTLLRLDSSAATGKPPVTTPHTGLFHTAFRYPDRASLGAAVVRTMEAAPEFQGASDHGVSEAVYFADPEGNGIELYRDRHYAEWPPAEPGKVGMFTRPLDLRALVDEAEAPSGAAECDVGHIHLMTADVDRAAKFWGGLIGLDERQRFGPQAIFLADGDYHHHVGANTWHSAGADPAPPDAPGLESFELRLSSALKVDTAAARLEEAGATVAIDAGRVSAFDPDGNRVILGSGTFPTSVPD